MRYFLHSDTSSHNIATRTDSKYIGATSDGIGALRLKLYNPKGKKK